MDDLRIRDQWPIMKTVIVWFAIIALLIAGLTGARVITLPAWLTFERKALTHSHQYIENKRTAIAEMSSECRPLPEGPQKQALRQRIAREMALIPQDAKPFNAGC